jgi:hypothetical protein
MPLGEEGAQGSYEGFHLQSKFHKGTVKRSKCKIKDTIFIKEVIPKLASTPLHPFVDVIILDTNDSWNEMAY